MKKIVTTHAIIAVIIHLGLSAFGQELKLPDKAAQLKQSYQTAVERATTPLTKTYLTQLNKLKIETTKSGDLQGALAIEAEITRLEAESTPAPSPAGLAAPASAKRLKSLKTTDEFIQWLANTKWKASTGKGFNFKGDGKNFAFVDELTQQETDSPFPISVLKIGVVEYKWGGTQTGRLLFSEDLKTCSDGNRKYEKVKEK